MISGSRVTVSYAITSPMVYYSERLDLSEKFGSIKLHLRETDFLLNAKISDVSRAVWYRDERSRQLHMRMI